MTGGSKSRRKKPEKISFEELMGAAGMSGFGALLEPPPRHLRSGLASGCAAQTGSASVSESLLEFSRKVAALGERLDRQSAVVRSLTAARARRVAALDRALRTSTWRRVATLPPPPGLRLRGTEGAPPLAP